MVFNPSQPLADILGRYGTDPILPPTEKLDAPTPPTDWGEFFAKGLGGSVPGVNDALSLASGVASAPPEPVTPLSDPTAIGPVSDVGVQDINTFEDFQKAGGPNDWEAWRMHARGAGKPDPGEASPSAGAVGMSGSQDRSQLSGGAYGVPAPPPTPPTPTVQLPPLTGAQSPGSTPATPPPPATAAGPAPATPAATSPATAATPASAPATAAPKPVETTQEVWILPDGQMVRPAAGATPPAGTVKAQLTPTQIKNIRQGGNETPRTPTNAPLDPGTALSKPTEGQLQVDTQTVRTADTPLGAYVNSKPLEGVAAMYVRRAAGSNASPEIIAQAAKNSVKGMAQALAKGDPNTDVYLNDIAKMAWYRQVGGMVNGQPVTPEMAPRDYVESWKGAWRTGKVVPLGAALDQQLIDNGQAPPAAKEIVNKAMTATAQQLLSDPSRVLAPIGRAYANVQAAQRVAQGDRGQYAGFTDAEYQAWSQVACGAASLAVMLKSATGKDISVGEGVNFLRSKGLLNKDLGLLRGSDFTDISKALNELAGEEVSFAVNYRSADALQKHFSDGGGAVMFTGPNPVAWGFTHIYVATGADADGVTIIDSSNRNKTRLTWDEWRGQTALAGAGAGAALFGKREVASNASGLNPGQLRSESIQGGGGALVTTGTDRLGSTRRKEEGTGGVGRPSSEGGGSLGTYSAEDVRILQEDIVRNAPTPDIQPGMSLQQRMAAWRPTLEYVQSQTGLPAEAIAGLLYAENRFGDSNLSKNHNNWFSMEYNAQYDRYASGSADGRFASYPTPKHALARFIGVIAHPENTYNTRGRLWDQRGSMDAFIDNMVKGGYIVEEPGFPVSTWINNMKAGANLYRQQA